MQKKTRVKILIFCVVCFLVGVPYIVLYSLGYRVDFANMRIFATGGIYVRSFPSADEIIIDSAKFEKPGIFANDVFIPNLLPIEHTILIKKTGYYDYTKTLPVQEKLATKLENVLLFKKDITFTEITDTSKNPFLPAQASLPANQNDKFTIRNNNLYFANTTQNKDLTTLQKTTPIIKGILAFTMQGNNILWLGLDGFMYRSDSNGKNPEKITTTAIKTYKTGNYKFIIDNKNTFLDNNGELLLLNTKTQDFETFAKNVFGASISPDGKYITYHTPNEIFMTSLVQNPEDPLSKAKDVSLYKSGTDITNLFWLNDSYIIFSAGNQIIISEIDYRSNINTTTLPTTTTLASTQKPFNITTPQIKLNTQEDKLYILSGKTLLATEKLLPY